MIKSGFFNAVNGDRTYNADDISNFFAGMLRDGIFKGFENELEVVANGNMSVTVKSGKALLGYKYMHNTTSTVLNVDAHSNFNRTDYVVAYSDLSTRTAGLKVVKGLQSGTNSELVPTSTYFVIQLASISVTTSTTSLTSSNITDLRYRSWMQFTNITTSFSQMVGRFAITDLAYDSTKSQYYIAFTNPIPVVGRDVIDVYCNGALMRYSVDYYFDTSVSNQFRVYFQNDDLVYARNHSQSNVTQYLTFQFLLNTSGNT